MVRNGAAGPAFGGSPGGIRPTTRAALVPAAVVVLSLCVLAAHAERYLPFISDDALISLRYAKRLLQGDGLTWTDGEAVEGYSNLLWILLVSLLGSFRIDLIDAARILGLLCNGLVVAALAFRYAASSLSKALPMLAGSATFVLAAPIAIWTIGGLEQPLVAALLAWAIALCLPSPGREDLGPRRTLWASLCLGLLCLTRPDGALFTASTALGILLVRGFGAPGWRSALPLAVLPGLFVLGQLLFRLVYYGEFVPNSALVKLSPSWLHFREGLGYVRDGFSSLGPISGLALAVALVGVVRLPKRDPSRQAFVFLLLQGGTWAGYVALVGGDIFPGFRHFAPVSVVLAFLVGEGLGWFTRAARTRTATALLLLASALALAGYAWGQSQNVENRRASLERWEWTGRDIGLTLKQGFGSARPLVAVTAAGCIPYWSELPSIDMLGLNDRFIARNRPEDFGQGRLGHELGDGEYVLARKPDLVVFHVGTRSAPFRSGAELRERPEFQRRYMPVRFEGGEPAEPFFVSVRRDSQKVGIRRSGSSIIVPAYMFNGNDETVAHLIGPGRFAVSVSASRPALLRDLALDPGRWRLEVDSDWELAASVRPSAGAGPALIQASLPLEFTVPGGEAMLLDLSLTSPPLLEVEVVEARLTRVGE